MAADSVIESGQIVTSHETPKAGKAVDVGKVVSDSPEYAKQADKVMLGVCNFNTTWGDKQANLDKIKSMTITAADMGVDIVAFPELALTGYECEGANGCGEDGMHKKLAESIPGPATEEIAKLAKEHDIYVIFGMPERDKTDPKKVYISAAVVGPEGCIGSYRKLHLASPPRGPEILCFTHGGESINEIPIFKTRYGPIGVTICYDFWRFPELTRIQVMKGAQILFNCTASAATLGGEPQPLMRLVTGSRAFENGVYAASSNLVGKDRTKLFYGHSTIAGPGSLTSAHIYAEGGSGEEIVTAVVSFKLMIKMGRKIRCFEDREAYSSRLILQELQKLSSIR